jgi:RNA polymerase sigma-70 factor (ECF subfamily)
VTWPSERKPPASARLRAGPSGRRAGTDRLEALPADRPGDGALLLRIRADDASALDLLLERYWPQVYRYALRRTGSADAAADLAQDVFCRVWERRAAWRPEGSVRGLLFRLARNTAVSHHRRRFARERAAGVFAHLHGGVTVSPLASDSPDLRATLDRAIAALPARRREVFRLRMVDDLSYDEIADAMGTSRQTVANQLSRALATLRQRLAHLLD